MDIQKPGEVKVHGMHSWIYLGVNGKGGIQAVGNEIGKNLLGVEAYMDKLFQVWCNNGGVLP